MRDEKAEERERERKKEKEGIISGYYNEKWNSTRETGFTPTNTRLSLLRLICRC